ncbi:hypothetical protein PILCRDRAFT_822846, partial [Piloderma croceum F 1598]
TLQISTWISQLLRLFPRPIKPSFPYLEPTQMKTSSRPPLLISRHHLLLHIHLLRLTKLYNLHKKSLAAERAARHAEAQLIDAGSISLRAEATREKKKNKQTSKEVGALLRLKLGDQIAYPSSASVDGHPKGLIGSMSQLVARMMFRRHEKFRPLANRKSAFTSHDYTRSMTENVFIRSISSMTWLG